MFAISVRVSPCSARCSPRSVGRVTRISPSTCSTLMSRGTRSDSSPFGPLTVTRSGSIATVTPDGTAMGCLPIRDMALPDPSHDLAADALAPGVVAGHHSPRGGDDGRAHPALDPRDVLAIHVGAPAWPRDPLHARDHRLAVLGVLERDRDLLARLTGARRAHLIAVDVA